MILRFWRNIRALAFSACALVLVSGSVALVSAQNPHGLPTLIPVFDDYPAAVEKRSTSKVDFKSQPAAQQFHAIMSDGAAHGVNFGGTLRLVEIGCGAGCMGFAIVDLVSSKLLYFTPNFSETTTNIQYAADSNLIIFNQRSEEESESENWLCERLQDVYGEAGLPKYLVWQKNKLEDVTPPVYRKENLHCEIEKERDAARAVGESAPQP